MAVRQVRARKLPSRPLSIAAPTLPAMFAEICASRSARRQERVPRVITIGSLQRVEQLPLDAPPAPGRREPADVHRRRS